ncbi:MAG: four helix bundle protein [bacterium]
MRDYQELDVWTKAHELVLKIYSRTESFPEDEKFGLTSQIRRASVSIPSNIAEGTGKNSDKEFSRFLEIARSSATELDYQLHLANDLGYIDDAKSDILQSNISEIKKMLTGFIDSLTNS